MISKRCQTTFALLALITVGLSGRAWVIFHRHVAPHDESITLLQVAGKAEYYQQKPFLEKWTRASDLQSLRHSHADDFSDIIEGLHRDDVHPPLYFLLLSVWLAPWKTPSLAVACALNLALFVLGCLGLFILAARLGLTPLACVAAVSLWAFSPVSLDVGCQARQYCLMSVEIIWFFVALVASTGTKRLVSLAAIFGLAFLMGGTNYPFLVEAPLLALLLFTSVGARKTTAAFLCSTAGVLLAWICFRPDGTQLTAGPGVLPANYALALSRTLLSLVVMTRSHTFEFFYTNHQAVFGLAMLVAGGLVLATVISFFKKEMRFVSLSFVLLIGIQIGFWLLGFFPRSSMDSRYISAGVPLMAVLVACSIQWSRRTTVRVAGLVAVSGLLLAGFALSVFYVTRNLTAFERADRHTLANYRCVVVDNSYRGIFLPFLDLTPPDATIFLTSPAMLAQRPLELPPDCTVLCYLHPPGYAAEQGHPDEMIANAWLRLFKRNGRRVALDYGLLSPLSQGSRYYRFFFDGSGSDAGDQQLPEHH